ncbi:hypothetical protein QEH59_03035 [Coraliomargarita sp. SDUM461004]|uniref:AAA family ATPase n=1 Tax=Thalassobacterium sedimentorum TaxID=3041258 RepID=A0ABU1AGT3_9BACT|nr:hypothetical protein [Coraliomargarita sp. SDUM461004]MDQ8193383.1 hypothetical protein [Coraliomargarita sp. SDUM461004]
MSNLSELPIDQPKTGGLLQKLKRATISSDDRISAMEKKRVEAVEVIPGMALQGQSTVFYMEQNGGKTLITFALLIQSIRNGTIDGDNLYYILADDTFNGGIEKAKLAASVGFNLVVPDSDDDALSLSDVVPLLIELAQSGEAAKNIIVIDTLKKVVSMMHKSASADFGKVSRSFVQAGGTLLTLGHVNKHKGDDGKAVFEGTNDIVNDFDCAYVGSIDTDKEDPKRQITFSNIKLRGPVRRKVSVSYDANSTTPWIKKLESVKILSSDEAEKVRELNESQKQLEQDLNIVCWIYDFLDDGAKLQTAIKTGGCPYGGQRRVEDALKRYGNMHKHEQFRFWTCQVGNKNARIYSRTINDPRVIIEDSSAGVIF